MGVSAQTNKAAYAGDGSTTSYSTVFTFAANDKVTFTKVVTATGVDAGRGRRRLSSVCKGDRPIARAVAVQALRELADEIEHEGAGTAVKWDPNFKIPVIKKRG
jgi:hypothetical protein